MNHDRINRFTERIPPHLADHWNEILDDIEKIDDSEMTVILDKLHNTARLLRVMQQWIHEGKLTKRHALDNYIDYVVDCIKENVWQN